VCLSKGTVAAAGRSRSLRRHRDGGERGGGKGDGVRWNGLGDTPSLCVRTHSIFFMCSENTF
jgi:hypothetical protein